MVATRNVRRPQESLRRFLLQGASPRLRGHQLHHRLEQQHPRYDVTIEQVGLDGVIGDEVLAEVDEIRHHLAVEVDGGAGQGALDEVEAESEEPAARISHCCWIKLLMKKKLRDISLNLSYKNA